MGCCGNNNKFKFNNLHYVKKEHTEKVKEMVYIFDGLQGRRTIPNEFIYFFFDVYNLIYDQNLTYNGVTASIVFRNLENEYGRLRRGELSFEDENIDIVNEDLTETYQEPEIIKPSDPIEEIQITLRYRNNFYVYRASKAARIYRCDTKHPVGLKKYYTQKEIDTLYEKYGVDIKVSYI